jgi:hypothetical protein
MSERRDAPLREDPLPAYPSTTNSTLPMPANVAR